MGYSKIRPLTIKILCGIISLILLYLSILEIVNYKELPSDEFYLMLKEEGRLESYINSLRIDWGRVIMLFIFSSLFFFLGVLEVDKK